MCEFFGNADIFLNFVLHLHVIFVLTFTKLVLISFNVFRPKITGCLLKQSAVCNSYHSDINTSLVKVKTNMLEKNFKECLHSQNNCALTET